MSADRIPGWRFITDQEWRRSDGVELHRAGAGWGVVPKAGAQPVAVASGNEEAACRAVDFGAFALLGVPAVHEFRDPAGLPALIEAIRHLHGVEATWLESVPVVETHEGQTVWAGEVQVFAVEHPVASRVYAWSHETDAGKRRFHAVLGAGVADSPAKAVQVAILQGAQGH